MNLKRLILVTTLSLVLGPVALKLADAQQAAKIPRIGVLWGPGAAASLEAFRTGLRDLGYVDGKNLVVQIRIADPQERLPQLAAELIRLDSDVLVTLGSGATRAANAATRTIPIVMVGAADPVGSGFASSLRYPGGNITGSTHMSAELSAKRLQLLKEIVPAATRVAALLNPADAGSSLDWKETEAAARGLGLTLSRIEVQAPAELESAFARMRQDRVDALVVFSHTFTWAHRNRIVELAARHHLPAMYGLGFTAVGGLADLRANFTELGRGAATFVVKILKGAKPADLPIEQPTTFQLIVNLKAARALGLTIPNAVLLRADQIIE